MDAVKFLEERNRMCNFYTTCVDCPASVKFCKVMGSDNAELMVSIVEKWSAEHPQKTMVQDFLEKYPNAPLDENGTPDEVCPHNLGYKAIPECAGTECKECWGRPVE